MHPPSSSTAQSLPSHYRLSPSGLLHHTRRQLLRTEYAPQLVSPLPEFALAALLPSLPVVVDHPLSSPSQHLRQWRCSALVTLMLSILIYHGAPPGA